MRRFLLPLSLAAVSAFAQTIPAGGKTPDVAPTGPPPGVVMFANSCTPAAQAPFVTGLLALHNFEYDEAAQFFDNARKLDGNCAIAGWGISMSYWHELWGGPSEKDIQRGREAAQWAQAHEKNTSARERQYIAAIAGYWDAMKTPDDEKRASAMYAARMKTLHQQNPEDNEATLFYALALISTEGGSNEQRQKQAREAGELIAPVMKSEPWNPGAAHYTIHAYDMPALAPDGLRAAREYARLAPDSPHALHMPSHIFAQLGLWQEMADSNEASYAAASNSTGNPAEKAHEELHALDYLQYAYLQLNAQDKAKRTTQMTLDTAKANPDMHTAYNRYGVVWRYPVELEEWTLIPQETPPDAKDGAFWQAEYAWLQLMGAAKLHDAARAKDWLAKFNMAAAETRKDPHGDEAAMLTVLQPEAMGWAAQAQGDNAAAIDNMRKAVAAESEPGAYGDFRKPANEILGDVLLAAGDKAGAAAAYRACLVDHKGRRLSVAGLAAATKAG